MNRCATVHAMRHEEREGACPIMNRLTTRATSMVPDEASIMAEEPSAQNTATVFVSYAHESPAFRTEVRGLCNWLREQGVAVVCDFDYAIKPPNLGWPAWMQQGIEDAGVVLVVRAWVMVSPTFTSVNCLMLATR